jgi:hypothetical protein
MKKKLSFVWIFLLVLSQLCWAITVKDKVGTCGAQFLKLGVGARARGMGDAFIGVADDAQAVFWNPAGLANIESKDLSFSHLSWIADVNHESFAYAQNFSNVGVFAVSAIMLGTEDMDVTTTQQQEGTGETFTYRDLAIGLSYARRLTDKFCFGLTLKYIDEQIYIKHARGFGVDVGTQYQTGLKSLTLSMAITNFGQDLRFEGTYFNTEVVSGTNTMLFEKRNFDRFPLPLKFGIGLTYDILEGKEFKSKIAFDVLHPNDYSERIHLGCENWYKDIVAFRLGYKLNYDEEGLCLGFGVKKRIGSLDFKIDYAYSYFGVFENLNAFSLGITF